MRNERGSITLFTLIGMTFILIIAFTAYTAAMIKLQAQNAELDQIVANYNKDINAEGLSTIYENLTNPEKGKASRYTCIDGVWCNSPELIGFNQMCTYYVTYDSAGNETICTESIAEMEAPPPNWYSYKEKRWANVVTINNGNKTYWVWIPRFKYRAAGTENPDLTAKTTDVKFVGEDENGNEICYVTENGEEQHLQLDERYKLSDAFTFNGQNLKGYWVSKYRVQEGENTKEKKEAERKEAEKNENMKNIEVDVSGFNPDVTKFVTYDDEGNETIGANIQIARDGTAQNKPQDWYDYKNKKWANIVTENNGNKTYWTYIPRFEYRIPIASEWKYLYPAQEKTFEVKFLKSTDTVEQGYKISDAFTFNGQQLRGYWVSKYRVQEGGNTQEKQEEEARLAGIEVDVSGFNPNVTKYVTYDDEGNETIGANIQLGSDGSAQNKPDNWYDYKNKKWANIVTENNGLKSYWTYIPRFQYRMPIWQYLYPEKTFEVQFIKSTDMPGQGFKMSDAFTFKGQQLKGYWASKYRVQDNTDNTEFNGTYYNMSN